MCENIEKNDICKKSTSTLNTIFYQRSIIFLSGAKNEKINKFPVFIDSEIGISKKFQKKIRHRVIYFHYLYIVFYE